MPATSSTILNLPVTLKPLNLTSLNGVTPAGQAKVIEAVVLSNTLLANPQNDPANYQIVLRTPSGQQFEVSSAKALPINSQVELKIGLNQQALILRLLNQPAVPGAPAQRSDNNPAPNSQALARPPAQVIEQGLRQALPLQQSLSDLLPTLINALNSPNSTALPKPILQTIQTLLRFSPNAQSLQNGAMLKKAILDSGTFLEPKLRQQWLQQTANPGASNHTSTANNPGIQQDTKAQIQQLLAQINRQLARSASPASESSPPKGRDVTAPQFTNERPVPGALIYNQSQRTSPTGSEERSDNTDTLLRQLAKQLLASLARTQLHQLDSLPTRQPADGSAAPLHTWSLELPIMAGQHVDNLQLKIEQRDAQNNQDPRKTATQWTVMLNFDLHTLGKLNIQLQIIETSLKAKIWAEKATTHQQVKNHLNELKENLQKVGVRVEKIDCYNGIPVTENKSLSQQLVDIRT